jgi:hypothetical protein
VAALEVAAAAAVVVVEVVAVATMTMRRSCLTCSRWVGHCQHDLHVHT